MIVGQIGAGVSCEELLSDYPYLEKEDIMQALQYAAAFSQWHEVALAEDGTFSREESRKGRKGAKHAKGKKEGARFPS